MTKDDYVKMIFDRMEGCGASARAGNITSSQFRAEMEYLKAALMDVNGR